MSIVSPFRVITHFLAARLPCPPESRLERGFVYGFGMHTTGDESLDGICGDSFRINLLIPAIPFAGSRILVYR